MISWMTDITVGVIIDTLQVCLTSTSVKSVVYLTTLGREGEEGAGAYAAAMHCLKVTTVPLLRNAYL